MPLGAVKILPSLRPVFKYAIFCPVKDRKLSGVFLGPLKIQTRS